jgi:hypothetical protein
VLFQPTGMSRRSSNRSKVEHATQVRNARRGWAQKRYACLSPWLTTCVCIIRPEHHVDSGVGVPYGFT